MQRDKTEAAIGLLEKFMSVGSPCNRNPESRRMMSGFRKERHSHGVGTIARFHNDKANRAWDNRLRDVRTNQIGEERLCVYGLSTGRRLYQRILACDKSTSSEV